MFTGIVQTTTKVNKVRSAAGQVILTLAKPAGWKITPGMSLAADGVCLTVKTVRKNEYTTELMPETIKKTYFQYHFPKFVNVELPLKMLDVLGGHLVLGHVDAVGRIKDIKSRGTSKIYKINFPKKFAKLVVPKGSIAVDGISLTVVDARRDWFTVSLVEYTIRHTTLGEKGEGNLVNLEFDILAKYLDRLLTYGTRSPKSGVQSI